jgi:hypothetical protein
MTDFEELLRLLKGGGVEFIVVGGVAAAAHGSARLTRDLGVVHSRSPENVRRLAAALAPEEPYLRGAAPGLPFRWDEATIRRGLNFTLTTRLGALDLLGEIAGGGGYDALLPHTVVLDLYGMQVRCPYLETLIRVRRAAGRPRDVEAVAELPALREERDLKPGGRAARAGRARDPV